ncbi:MAG: hypothetical protein AAFX04_03365 [Pseudomonadota bacterium]
MKYLYWGLGLAMLAGAQPALAKKDPPARHFFECDGFQAPRKKDDGLSVTSGWLGIGTTTKDAKRGSFQAGAGIDACDKALADPLLQPHFHLRRASLYQGKAIHLAARGKYDEALASFAQSDAVRSALSGAEQEAFDESVALTNAMLRSYILLEQFKTEEAMATLAELRDVRRYSPTVQAAFMLMGLQDVDDFDNYAASLREQAILDPDILPVVFWLHFVGNQVTGAAEYRDQFFFVEPSMRGNWRMTNAALRELQTIIRKSDFGGASAYALHADGKVEEARAVFTELEDWLAELATEPKPKGRRKKPSRKAMKAYKRQLPFVERAQRTVQGWRDATVLRDQAATMPMEAVGEMVNDTENLPRMAAIDLLLLPATTSDKDNPEAEEALAAIPELIKERIRKASAVNVETLVRLLPQAETAPMRPLFENAGSELIFGDASGFSKSYHKDEDHWTVRYGSDQSLRVVAEEMVVYGAARLAKEKGKDAFLVLAQRSFPREITQTGYFSAGTYSAGFESQMRIALIDSANPDPQYSASLWRLVMVDDVLAHFSDRYVATSAYRD